MGFRLRSQVLGLDDPGPAVHTAKEIDVAVSQDLEQPRAERRLVGRHLARLQCAHRAILNQLARRLAVEAQAVCVAVESTEIRHDPLFPHCRASSGNRPHFYDYSPCVDGKHMRLRQV